MGEFADAMEAKESATTSEPSAPADSGSAAPVDSAPSSPDPAPSAPGEAKPSPTTPPAAAPAPASAAPVAGKSAPQMVRYEALKEAREQAKALKESYGWLPPERAPHVRQFVENFQRDPVQTLVGELQLLLQHPQYGPQLQALMGQNGGDDPEPAPDYRTPDGDEVRSAKNQAAWNEWRERKLQQQFSEKLRPLEQYVQTHQQQSKLTELRTAADAKAKALLEPYLGDEHFQTHRADIRARFQEYVGEMPGETALHRAYVEIIREKVLPGLSTRSAQAVVQQLNRKPGSTGPNPARPTPAAAPRAKFADFRDALEAGVIGR